MSPPGASDSRAEAPLEAGNPASSDGLIAALQAQNAAQQVFIAELQTRIAELERRLVLTYSPSRLSSR
jgi:hypothetical protein